MLMSPGGLRLLTAIKGDVFSIGGAIENLIIAADHFGYSSTISYFPKPVSSASNAYQSNDIVARVSLQPGAMPSADPRLFSAITPDGMNASQKRTGEPH
ncbi:MAG: hypothetical protein IPI63_12520 [Methanothrix sp.]|uniref:hypothetical protein n=1 Tax=Methanothrix sp. TaxID=90426 RepID=UPI0025E117A3|nr:hypothetical protein [Methanothrix sp.]MBK7387479.1 hypothetical protein [Methanothrix sp.]